MPVDVPQVGRDIDPHAVYHLNTVADAKEEWMCQLVDLLGPRLVSCFQRIGEAAPRVARRQNMDTRVCFETLLREVPLWNRGIIQEEVRDMFREEEERTLYDVLKACYVATTVVMASIRTRRDNKELQISVPKVEDFVHECCKEFASRLLGDPLLVVNRGGVRERAYKREQTDRMANRCVRLTLRRMLPVKQMMRSYLDDVLVEGDEQPAGAAEPEEIPEEVVPAEVPAQVPAEEGAAVGAAMGASAEGAAVGASAEGAADGADEGADEAAAAPAGSEGEDVPVVDDEPVVYRSASRRASEEEAPAQSGGRGLDSLLRDVESTTTPLGTLNFDFWPAAREQKVVPLTGP